jgi:hypothetical protein
LGVQEMGLLRLAIAAAICGFGAVVVAQSRVSDAPSGATSSVGVQTSKAQSAIDRAAAANKYVFLFFWKEKDRQTDDAWVAVQSGLTKLADKAQAVKVQVTDPAEKKLVDKYCTRGAPMPLVLAIAPCGAITKGFAKTFDEQQFRTAFVSPCTQRFLKAMQSGKLAFICLVDQANPRDKTPIPKGVEDFKADKKYGAAAEIVMLNVRDPQEAPLLKELDVSARHAPMTILLAPPGSVVGTFSRSTAKDTFIAKLTAPQSGCGAGGCGAGGCGPKSK